MNVENKQNKNKIINNKTTKINNKNTNSTQDNIDKTKKNNPKPDLTEEQFIKMCCDNYIIVDKMEIIDYNDDDEDDEDKRESLGTCIFCMTDIFEDIKYCAKCNLLCCVDCFEISSTNGTNKIMCIKCYKNMCRSCNFKYVNDEKPLISCKKCIKKISNIKHKFN